MEKREEIMKEFEENMKKYEGNMKEYERNSPYIWAVGLGKIPSSSSYLGEGVGVVRNFQV